MSNRLVVCLPSWVFGGHERMLLRILRVLRGHAREDIAVVCRSAPKIQDEIVAVPGLAVSAGYGIPRKRWVNRIVSLMATAAAVRSVPVGGWVLLAPGGISVQLIHILVAKLLGRRVAVYVPMCFPASVTGLRPAGLRDAICRRIVRAVDLWVTITQAQHELLRTFWKVCTPIEVVPNVDDGCTDSTPAVAQQLEDQRLRVVFLGRYDSFQKGLDWLSEALVETRDAWRGRILFEFYGEGEFKSRLDEIAAVCGEGNVVVHGWTSSQIALARAHVLLLPSRFEGFPLVFLEAVKARVAVVTTKFSGAQGILGDGAWIDFGNTGQLMSSLRRMMDVGTRDQLITVQREAVGSQASTEKFDAAVARLAGLLELNR